MIDQHPAEDELVRFAFGDTRVEWDGMPRHLAECAECRGVADRLRTHANALRLAATPAIEAMPGCLDDESIAAFAEGSMDSVDAPGIVRHLLECAHCRSEVASVARLLDDASVRTERVRLDDQSKPRHRRSFVGAGILAGALAASVLLVVVSRSSKVSKPLTREESVTGAAAPRLISVPGGALTFEALKWTSVPRADRYRITVFARDGSVIWEAQTRDTAIAAPDVVARAPEDTILWRVDAHVGWEDRWASSDLEILTVPHAKR